MFGADSLGLQNCHTFCPDLAIHTIDLVICKNGTDYSSINMGNVKQFLSYMYVMDT